MVRTRRLTGLGLLPNSQVPRKLKLNIDTTSELHQWLTLKELQCGVRNHEATQTFVDNKKTLRMLADGLRNHDPNAKSRVKLMSGGEVLGTALLTWLRDTEDEIELARRVVKAVWPRVCTKRSQTHAGWAVSCEIKMDFVTEIESWIRTNRARCERHLTKREYFCRGCQHGLCTVCNDIENRTHGPWCMAPFPQLPNGHSEQNSSRGTQCLNLHTLGEQWIEE